MITIYGIPNCDTMKRARAWLATAGVEAAFHDWKRGVDARLLGEWADRVGWETLLNRSGTTFRKLPEEAKVGLDQGRAVALMVAHPSAIRRPVLVHGTAIEVGFDPARYAALFGGKSSSSAPAPARGRGPG